MKIRTSAPTGEPYYFPSGSKGQCTWYAYYRVQEIFGVGVYPCYRNAQKGQGFNNAKKWIDFRREDWIETQTCVAGDIAVFDGNYGHVVVVEKVNGDGTALISQYNLDIKEGFSNATWKIGERLKGKIASTGNFMGFLHYIKNTQEIDYKALYEEAQSKLNKISEDIKLWKI